MNDSTCRWMVLGAVACAMIVTEAVASGFRNPPEGAAALALGGGKVALTEDASVVSHNPASLADFKQNQILPTVTFIHTETEFTSPVGAAETDDPWKVLPNLYVAWPIKDSRYVAGLGVTTPYGQSTKWDEDGAFRYSAPYSAELTVVNVNPTLAARVNERVAVGVGADVYWSQVSLKQRMPWSMLTGSPLSADGVIHAEGEGMAVGANAAVSVKVTDKQTVSLTYRCPFSVDYEGDVDVSQMPAGAQALGLSPSSDFDTTVDFPAVAALSYAIKMTDTVRVGADVEWIQFSRYENLVLDAGKNNILLNGPGAANPMAPAAMPQDWDDTWTAGVGADWRVAPNVTLRAGYIHLQSPIPDETLAPSLPDATRDVVSVGFGYTHGRQTLDLAYGYSIIPTREIRTDVNPAYNGDYETSSHLMSVSYGYAF